MIVAGVRIKAVHYQLIELKKLSNRIKTMDMEYIQFEQCGSSVHIETDYVQVKAIQNHFFSQATKPSPVLMNT